MSQGSEIIKRFDCFGGSVGVYAGGSPSGERGTRLAVSLAVARLRSVHSRLSRFLPESELSRLNRDPRTAVPASGLLLELADAVRHAGEISGGLVDATQVDAIEDAGYGYSRAGLRPLPLAETLAAVRGREAARADSRRNWLALRADTDARVVRRPPGLRLDSGGLAKGLAADLAAQTLGCQSTFAVDCCGDIRVGGTAGIPRPVAVADPFGGEPVHQLELTTGAAATSGIGNRSWLDQNGEPAHHVLDPSTGRPAYTGVVQATALAPTALLAETLAKAALLSGPDAGQRWLSYGGVLVLDDGEAVVVEAVDHARAAA